MTRLVLVVLLMVPALALGQGVDPGSVVSLEIPETLEVPRGGTSALVIAIDIEPDWHVNAPGSPGFLIPLQVELRLPEYLKAGEVKFPEPQQDEVLGQTLLLYSGKISVEIPISAASNSPLTEAFIEGVVKYQACSGDICLPPAEKPFQARIKIVEEATPSAVSPGIGGQGEPVEENPIGRLVRERGLFLALLGVFLLGLGLNLTPCVYPMVPITVAYFGGVRGRTKRTLAMALLYVLGLATVYSGLGVLAAATGRLFGEALQRPWVWGIAAGVMVAMALSFFGVYHLRAPTFLTRRLPKGGRGGPIGAFLMGAFAGVVAAPCVGPATLALLSYVGVTQDVGLGFVLFFALSLGLGSPYVLLALFSQRLTRLPRTGAWTVWVERLLGFVLLGLALYFVSPFIPGAIFPWLVAALALSGAIYLGVLQRSRGGFAFRLVRGLVGAAGIAAAVLFLAPAVHAPAETGVGISWEEYDPALLKAGKPVLLFFTADWCVYCHKLESVTFEDKSFVSFFESTGITPVKVDLTVRNPITDAIRKRYGVLGVPYLILLSPAGEELLRHGGYIEPDRLERALREALGLSGG